MIENKASADQLILRPKLPVERRTFVEAAREIVAAIRNSALSGSLGAGFIAPACAFADESLYSGTAGIAVFLAAASHVLEQDRTEMEALLSDVLAPIRAILSVRNERKALLKRVGIGGATGVGSILYALAFIARLHNNASIGQEALVAARLIDAKAIENDRELDIIGGAAGAILGLLALYDLTDDRGLLARATLCAEHLLRSRIDTPSGYRAWPYRGGQVALSGFSHGAAGIAYALARLFEKTWDERLLHAAQEAVLHERALFDPHAQNFRDLRPEIGASSPALCCFCHGAAGIGLARIYGAKILRDKAIDAEIATCVGTTLRFGLGAIDHLCCGNAGRVELLLASGEYLGRPDLVNAAFNLMARVEARAAARGGYALGCGLDHHISMQSLFCGTAGIGYQLLRLEAPHLLPSVLGWEMPQKLETCESTFYNSNAA